MNEFSKKSKFYLCLIKHIHRWPCHSSGGAIGQTVTAIRSGLSRPMRKKKGAFLTAELDCRAWSASRPGRVIPMERAPPPPVSNKQKVEWVSKPVWTLTSTSSSRVRQAVSQSLHRISYTGSYVQFYPCSIIASMPCKSC
jgi:hypothetical protein